MAPPPLTGSSLALVKRAPTSVAKMPASSRVPKEVWFDIVDLLGVSPVEPELPMNTKELMNVRLINHDIAEYATRYLFDGNVISPNADSFINLRHAYTEHGDHIETYYISPRKQDNIDQAEYNRRVRVSFGRKPNPEWAGHSTAGFTRYCSEMEDTKKILTERELGFQLIRALNALLPRIPRVVIRASRYIPKYSKERLDEVIMSYSPSSRERSLLML